MSGEEERERSDEPIPIWPNVKWALLLVLASLFVWWIADPIVRWLGLDELAP